MFRSRFFGARYWAARFWGAAPVAASMTGDGSERRQRQYGRPRKTWREEQREADAAKTAQRRQRQLLDDEDVLVILETRHG